MWLVGEDSKCRSSGYECQVHTNAEHEKRDKQKPKRSHMRMSNVAKLFHHGFLHNTFLKGFWKIHKKKGHILAPPHWAVVTVGSKRKCLQLILESVDRNPQPPKADKGRRGF